MNLWQNVASLALWALLNAALSSQASADGQRLAAPDYPRYRSECGSCHVAFPPGLLLAREWRSVLASLDRHYGSDASLPPAGAEAIAAYLVRNAGTDRVASAENPPRITTSRWFKREHREVSPAVWSRPAIGSAANCAACHPGAEAGRFDEHAVRIPR